MPISCIPSSYAQHLGPPRCKLQFPPGAEQHGLRSYTTYVTLLVASDRTIVLFRPHLRARQAILLTCLYTLFNVKADNDCSNSKNLGKAPQAQRSKERGYDAGPGQASSVVFELGLGGGL